MVLAPPSTSGTSQASSESGTINRSYYTLSSTIFSFSICAALPFHDMKQRKTEFNQNTSFTQPTKTISRPANILKLEGKISLSTGL